MTSFQVPVRHYMTSPALTVASDATLDEAYSKLTDHKISSLAVVDGERLVGVLSRTDLLRVGRREAGAAHDASALTFPAKKISEIMTAEPMTVGPEDHVSDAAKVMTKHRLHRIFVSEGETLVGVFSTKDVMKAIQEKRYRVPISELMTSPVFTVRAEEPVSLAIERLEKAHVSGLVVIDEQWPVGVFTQEEALASKDLHRDTPNEEVMSAAMICLDVSTPLHRAAAQAVSMDVRRIVAVETRKMEGILTGLDFARAAAR